MSGLWLSTGGADRRSLCALGKIDSLQLFHNGFVNHTIAFGRILQEFALLLREAITANFLLSVDALQTEGPILRLKLGECRIICDIIGFIQKI